MSRVVAEQFGVHIPAIEPPPAPQKIVHVVEYGRHGSVYKTTSLTDLARFLRYLEDDGQEVIRVYLEQHFC